MQGLGSITNFKVVMGIFTLPYLQIGSKFIMHRVKGDTGHCWKYTEPVYCVFHFKIEQNNFFVHLSGNFSLASPKYNKSA